MFILVGVWVVDYQMTREGTNPKVLKAKLFVMRKKDKTKAEGRETGK